MRSDEKPFLVESSSFGGFRAGANRSYQRVLVATVHQHGRMTLAAGKKPVSQMKDAERRDKMSKRSGKDTGSRQDP